MGIRSLIKKYRRRPFPSNLLALRCCRISYSQFGEDLFVSGLLGYERTDGFFVDVGCYHPIVYSNTYIFYQRGWRGVAVDPNRDMAPLWERYRKRDRFVSCAVGSKPGFVWYRTFAGNGLENRIDERLPAEPGVDGQDAGYRVERRSLSDLLKENCPSGIKIDYLNIDCEGSDLDVLQSLDFNLFYPLVISVEDFEATAESKISLHLGASGFSLDASVGYTKIFVRDDG